MQIPILKFLCFNGKNPNKNVTIVAHLDKFWYAFLI